ncbi:MAG: hypothetical protein EOR81_04490 [Mesorhizobium sp.]|nr:MAG: hypothetical protein EOR81_04490 [Mesorhizobium sp.]
MIVAYAVLTFVCHHLLRPEPSVAALAEGDAALNGLGLACLPDALRPFLAEGRLQQVLEDLVPAFSRLHLYYPSRRRPRSLSRSKRSAGEDSPAGPTNKFSAASPFIAIWSVPLSRLGCTFQLARRTE